MDYQAELLAEARKAIAACPDKRSDIIELYRLAMDEIGDGESAAHEYELFMDSINEIKQGS
jgi:hypothetical protein